MMLLTFPTAYLFWMYYGLHEELHQPVQSLVDYLPRPLHIMVSKHVNRKSDCEKVYHLISENIPQNSIVRVSDEYSVISPELCFLFAARELTIEELVMEADNLCGLFFLNPNDELRLGRRVPITSVKIIRNYLGSIHNVKGIKKARAAIQYATDRSASPIESKNAAISRLPFCRGGFALPDPELNYYALLSESGALILQRDRCCCDMVWPELKVIVEYDSDQFHLEKDQFYYDKRRGTALNMSGFKVINVTRDNLRSFASIEGLFLSIRNTLNLRTRKCQWEKHRDKRIQTVRNIFFRDWKREIINGSRR